MSKTKSTKRKGRPPLAKGKVKDILIVVRLTPAFHKALCAAAKREGQTVTEYVRGTLAERLDLDREE